MDQASRGCMRAIWGSFDDSTNAPVVYPNGTSIASLESQMLMQVTSTTLPPGNVDTAYSTQLTGSGGSGPPYTWSLAAGSPRLALWAARCPPMAGSRAPPAASGISSFFVQMTDPHRRASRSGR